MAKIIGTNIESQKIGQFYPFWKIFFIGLFLGVLYWWLTSFVGWLIIAPVFCSTASGAWICSDLIGVSGDVATIIIAFLSILIMLYFRMHQPLIIAVSAGFLLWGLSRWTEGLPIKEIISWDIGLYLLSYILFSWVNRYLYITTVIISTVLIMAIIRTSLSI